MAGVVEKSIDKAAIMAVLETVPDPEIPVLSITDLGIVRGIEESPPRVRISPTYTGCPALDMMRADLRRRLADAGYTDVRVRTVLDPPWTTDWISDEGRRKLREAGIAPPGPAPRRPSGPIPLTLGPTRRVQCPHCGSADTFELSRFGATACKSLRRCESCREPFEHFKEI